MVTVVLQPPCGYKEYTASANYIEPDLVAALNCGFIFYNSWDSRCAVPCSVFILYSTLKSGLYAAAERSATAVHRVLPGTLLQIAKCSGCVHNVSIGAIYCRKTAD